MFIVLAAPAEDQKMQHGRLPWLEPSELDAAQRALYDRILQSPRTSGPQALTLTDATGRLEGPFNALLFAPDVGCAVSDLGVAVRYATSLSDRTREIAILELAAQRRSEFEWYAHSRIGARAGLTMEEIDALRTGAPAPTLTPLEALVRTVVRELVINRTLESALHERFIAEADRRALVELVVLVGCYDLIALNLAVWQTPLPANEPTTFPAPAPRSPTSEGLTRTEHLDLGR